MNGQQEGGGSGGGISIGRMTGGAAAGGKGAKAEDRSERVGPQVPVGPSGTPVPAEVPVEGGVAVGEMSGGAVAAGERAEAVDASRQLFLVTPELLDAVRLVQQDLPLLARTDGDRLDEVDAELAGLREEAWRTGRTGRPRLERLRSLLSAGATAAGGLASAVTLVQAITSLLA
ncbi:hypothetical protein ACFY2W_37040 [Streptomyces sp. NPDC001262]|uniref:hypothetical protein n=1 Tax=Streptomyces TaxID=1883 RepID=UPI0036B160EA